MSIILKFSPQHRNCITSSIFSMKAYYIVFSCFIISCFWYAVAIFFWFDIIQGLIGLQLLGLWFSGGLHLFNPCLMFILILYQHILVHTMHFNSLRITYKVRCNIAKYIKIFYFPVRKRETICSQARSLTETDVWLS